MIDGRKHPTQSLLSPALATFQNEALCMFMPGITLNTEQLCKLQHPTGGASSAHGGRASAKLLSIYAIAEVPCVVSGPAMYLFDPSGKYLTASVKTGDSSSGSSSSKGPAGLGRAYPLVPNELPNRFPDQFAPLALFGFRPNGGRPMDGTLIRLPLRSQLLANHSSLATQFWSIPRARTLVRVLRKHASTLLLGLDHVEAVTASEWAPNGSGSSFTASAPSTTLKVSRAASSRRRRTARRTRPRSVMAQSVVAVGLLVDAVR